VSSFKLDAANLNGRHQIRPTLWRLFGALSLSLCGSQGGEQLVSPLGLLWRANSSGRRAIWWRLGCVRGCCSEVEGEQEKQCRLSGANLRQFGRAGVQSGGCRLGGESGENTENLENRQKAEKTQNLRLQKHTQPLTVSKRSNSSNSSNSSNRQSIPPPFAPNPQSSATLSQRNTGPPKATHLELCYFFHFI